MEPAENSRECTESFGFPSISTVENNKGLHNIITSRSCSKQPLFFSPVRTCVSRDSYMNHQSVVSAIFCRMLAVDLSAFYLAVIVIVMGMSPAAVAFNVDIERAFVISGDNDSMFGFAVAQHIDQSINWLLIGAPNAQTIQPNVVRGGAVFRCRTDVKNACQNIPFDDAGNRQHFVQSISSYQTIEQKSGQWFGSTVKSSGQSGVIVACAPRYVYFTAAADKREPIGVCYLAGSRTSDTTYVKYTPCETAVDYSDAIDQYHRQGYCQAGFSAVLSNDGKRLLIGAPGSWYWQGQLFNYGTDRPNGRQLNSTPEGKATDDDTYMGYSSAIGEFDGDGNDDYVVGTPKAEHYLGRVDIFNQSLSKIGYIVGEQIGAYFGYSLAVVDLNADSMDDIIVGAPMYAELESSDAYDTGRVYIYYQTSNGVFQQQTRDTLDGHSSNSRFGMALSHLGDINYDGFNDLCVGAPYAGDDKKGAIYIFHGSQKGIKTEASQIIYAKDIETSLSAFGISISGGLDQDANQYPDLLVGAYTSDKAVFLRTKPVVRVTTSLKLIPDKINLDSQLCALSDNTRVPCLSVETCIKYDGVGVPDVLEFNITWILDAKQSNTSLQEQRAFYINSAGKFSDSKTHTLQKKNEFCTTSYAYVKKDPNDKLSPIKVTMEFKLNEITQLNQKALPPILDAYIPTTTSFTADILKDCGIDNVCVPDLAVLAVRTPSQHKIGTSSSLETIISVFNHGEDSFNTNLWIDLPTGVTYNTIKSQNPNVAISCDALKSDHSKVVCSLGNPMQKGTESVFTMVLTPTNANNTMNRLVFNLFVNSTNVEKAETYENNHARFEIPVTVEEPVIGLYGISNPELVILNTTEEKGEDKGTYIKHVFQLKNEAQYATKETELQIKWPTYDTQGNPVLLIERELGIDGKGECKIIILTPINASDYTGLGNLNTEVELNDLTRQKRDANSNTIACSDRYCTIIQCNVGYLERSQSFILTVESRLMVRGLIQRREATEMYHITTVAFARVKSLPFDFVPVDAGRFGVKRLEVITKINTDLHKPASKGIEVWIIAVAITAGILALLLLILLLWWCGFFKRKKPMEEGYFVVNGTTADNTVSD